MIKLQLVSHGAKLLACRFQNKNWPRRYERIYVQPSINFGIPSVRLGREYSGSVQGGDWDLNPIHISKHSKVSACLRHWVDGMSWEETGIIDQMMRWIREVGPSSMHGETYDDVLKRYRELDKIFCIVSRERKLNSYASWTRLGNYFIEPDAILIHIDRNNNPLFGGSGCHRFAMSIALNLPLIPACVGAVHVDAVSRWRDKYVNIDL